MKAKRIFTRQLFGLDYRIARVMLILGILSISLLSYRLIGTSKCAPAGFVIKTITTHTDSNYMAGETITFIAPANASEISWDFGDNSPKITGQFVTHIFLKTGSFTITASTGVSCETNRTINIKQPSDLNQSNGLTVAGEEIIGPVSASAGIEQTFTCMVTAKSYEWSIPNYPKMLRTGSTAKFIFPAAGKFLVQVTLDHDRTKRFSKEVTVEAIATEKSPVMEDIKPLIPSGVQPLPPVNNNNNSNTTLKISDAVFADNLSRVIDKQMTVVEFDKYLCYKGETKVVSNGDVITFNALCEEISGKKRRKFIIGKTKIKITSVVQRRDNDGCVNIIEVKYH
jgi:hypothetical protein